MPAALPRWSAVVLSVIVGCRSCEDVRRADSKGRECHGVQRQRRVEVGQVGFEQRDHLGGVGCEWVGCVVGLVVDGGSLLRGSWRGCRVAGCRDVTSGRSSGVPGPAAIVRSGTAIGTGCVEAL